MGEYKAVYRYEVPVDDAAHEHLLQGEIVGVEAKDIYTVEFWAEKNSQSRQVPRSFRVYGTGHPIPVTAMWAGTCSRISGPVWHLYEL
jgi:hypothetical protein